MKRQEQQEPIPEAAGAAQPQTEQAAEMPQTGEAAQTSDTAQTPEGVQTAEESLHAEIASLQAESAEYKRKWYAVTAEYENYRRRTRDVSASRYREGRADVVSKLFPIADNLERALQSCQDESTRQGIAMVMKAFEKVLEEENVTVIDPQGMSFDAEKHEAIMAVDPAEGEESGTVRQVYLKGYEQNGKVLRFAQVVVVK